MARVVQSNWKREERNKETFNGGWKKMCVGASIVCVNMYVLYL